MCICIVNVYIPIYTYIYIYIYIFTYMYKYIYIHKYLYIYTSIGGKGRAEISSFSYLFLIYGSESFSNKSYANVSCLTTKCFLKKSSPLNSLLQYLKQHRAFPSASTLQLDAIHFSKISSCLADNCLQSSSSIVPQYSIYT
jgi:hypothetical protein